MEGKFAVLNDDSYGLYYRITDAVLRTVPGTNVVVYDTTRLGCGLDMTGKADGSYNLVLRNPDAETVTMSGALTVQSAP